MSQKVKIVHRYVPRDVGEIILRILWLLDPWVKQLQAMVHGQTDFSPSMWGIGERMKMQMKGWRMQQDYGEVDGAALPSVRKVQLSLMTNGLLEKHTWSHFDDLTGFQDNSQSAPV